MDDRTTAELVAEWTGRGRTIASYVADNVPREFVPVVVFDHVWPDPDKPDPVRVESDR